MRGRDLLAYSWVPTYLASRVRGAWYRLRHALNPRVRIGPGLRAEGPLTIRGQGRVHIGKNVLVRRSNTVEVVIQTISPGALVTIADRAGLGGTQILCGNRVSIDEGAFTANCRIQDVDFSAPGLDPHPGTVRVGKGVWLGLSSMLLKQADVGDSAIVAAGSVVDRAVARLAIAMGNIARPLQGLVGGPPKAP
jgi:acetyltransferase-like isoleucine patch superfamily enzyme